MQNIKKEEQEEAKSIAKHKTPLSREKGEDRRNGNMMYMWRQCRS